MRYHILRLLMNYVWVAAPLMLKIKRLGLLPPFMLNIKGLGLPPPVIVLSSVMGTAASIRCLGSSIGCLTVLFLAQITCCVKQAV